MKNLLTILFAVALGLNLSAPPVAYGMHEDVPLVIGADSCATSVEFDDYTYPVVSIGNQCWFAENLRSLHYANGDQIDNALTADEWANTTSGACAILWENTSNPYLSGNQDTLDWALQTFGRLYNFYSVTDDRKICPAGWHVSTDSDWIELEIFLGLSDDELYLNNSSTRGAAVNLGHKLKDTQLWFSPSLGFGCDGIQSNGTWSYLGYLTTNTRMYGPPLLNLLGTGRRIEEYYGWSYNSFVWSPNGEQPVWRYTLAHWSGLARSEPETANHQGNPVRCVQDYSMDIDQDGISDDFESAGCTASNACNYDSAATYDDGSCDYCFCGEGTQWIDSLQACTVTEAALTQTCGDGTYWDEFAQACLTIETCQEDLNGDGIVGMNDLLELLTSFGNACNTELATVEVACGDSMNYNGYDYATVQIGEQCWFAEDLKSHHFRNGDSLINVKTNVSDVVGATFYTALNDTILNGAEITLYNTLVFTDSREICPTGWSIPSDTDWHELLVFAGMDPEEPPTFGQAQGDSVSIRLKSVEYWQDISWPTGCINAPQGLDSYGMNIVPSGYGEYRNESNGPIDNIEPWLGAITYFHTRDIYQGALWLRGFPCNDAIINQPFNIDRNWHGAIRCLKDTEE